MSAQIAEPAVEEFHRITVALTGDYTEITCTECGPLERAATVAHGADHAIATGHTVTEQHVRVTVITGYPS